MDAPPPYGSKTGSAVLYAPPPLHPMMIPPSPARVDFMHTPPVMIQQPTVMSVQYGSRPLPVTCPYCNQRVLTKLSHEAGGLTYLASFGIAFFCPFGCCFIPCCVDSCQDVYHRCPACGVQLGIHKRL